MDRNRRIIIPIVALFAMSTGLLFGDTVPPVSVTVPVAQKNSYTLDELTFKAVAQGITMYVFPGATYQFQYQGNKVPVVDWVATAQNPNPFSKTISKTQDWGTSVTIGSVLFHNPKGRESDFTSTVIVTLPKVKLQSVLFENAQQLINYNTDFAGDGKNPYAPQGWVNGGANNPVCYAKSQNVKCLVSIAIDPAGLPLSLSGVGDASKGFNRIKFPLTAVPKDASTPKGVHMTSVSVLGDSPGVINKNSFTWSLAGMGGSSVSVGDSGPHKIYVTWDTPGANAGAVTEKRINYVCSTAQGCNSQEKCADALWNSSELTVRRWEFARGQADVTARYWKLLDSHLGSSYKGECIDWANSMALAMEMLGIKAGTMWVCASPKAGAGNCSIPINPPLYKRPCPKDRDAAGNPVPAGTGIDHGPEWLVLTFSGVPNLGEGCCVSAGKYYALYPKFKTADDFLMLKAVVEKKSLHVEQWWYSLSSSGSPIFAQDYQPVPW